MEWIRWRDSTIGCCRVRGKANSHRLCKSSKSRSIYLQPETRTAGTSMKEVIVAHPLPPFSTLARFRRNAKQLLKTYRENPSICEERIACHCPDDLGPGFRLADAQRVVA